MRTAVTKGVQGLLWGLTAAALVVACTATDRDFGKGGLGGASGSAVDTAGDQGVNGGGATGGSSSGLAGDAAGGEPAGADPCMEDPCVNGGVCANVDGRAICTCDAAYEGDHCEESVDDCADEPCGNGGTCIDGDGSFTCSCATGFSGARCERAVSGCADKPCLNGATCADQASSYKCTCPAGFSGTNCEVNIDDCANNPCQNGGGCSDGVNTYTCACTSRYTGPKCEHLEVKLVPSTFLSGAYRTTATALSNDGKVLLMNLSNSSGVQGIARLVDFDQANTLPLSSPYSGGAGFGINEDGSTITGEGTSDDSVLAVKVVGTITSLLDLSLSGWQNDYSAGLDVSADGTAFVGRLGSFSGGSTAFYCKTGKACREVPMDAGGIAKAAYGVSGDGTVVVGYTFPSDPTNGMGTAWRWVTSNAKATVLTLGAGTWALPSAKGVSRDGKVVVGDAEINGVLHAVRWSGASFTPADLGTGQARATNADGSVTVGVDNASVPIVWLGTTRHTLASLLGSNPDLSGATLTDLVAVSDDGKVVGGTAKIGGNDRAFMARLP